MLHVRGDEGNPVQRERIAPTWRTAKLAREQVCEAGAALLRLDRNAIDFREGPKGRVGGHEEIAQQARVGPGRRRQVGKETVERLRALGRGKEIEIVARTYRLGFRR